MRLNASPAATATTLSIGAALRRAQDIARSGARWALGMLLCLATTFAAATDPAPTVVITCPITAAATNLSATTFTATFNKAVTGFDITGITAVNATVGDFTVVNATVYTFSMTVGTEGVFSAKVNAGCCLSTLGTANLASAVFSKTYDVTAPTTAITSTAPSPTNTTIPIKITFSEAVVGFILTDITVSGGTVASFAGSGATYTAIVTATGDGIVSVDVAGSACTDIAGNANVAATQLVRTFDHTAPTATITTTAQSPVNAAYPVTVTFSEDVTGFVAANLTMTSGTISSFAGSGSTYTFTVTPTAQGNVTVALAASKTKDLAGNFNTAATSLVVVFDSVRPTAVFTSTVSTATTNLATIPMTLTFSEVVTGFDISQIAVTNGTTSNAAGSGRTYTFDVAPTAEGAVTLNYAIGQVADAANNTNTAASAFIRTYDTTAPTISITSTGPALTNAVIPIKITFSEAVTGFTLSDITVGNGTASTLLGSGASYTANVTATTDGQVTVDVADAVCTDIAGNADIGASQFSVAFDKTSPSAVIATSTPTPSNVPFAVTVSFDEAVTGFVASDLSVTNGTISSFTGSGASYSMVITPATQGNVTITLTSAKCTDLAGNNNNAATALVVVFDTVRPTVVFTSTVGAASTNLSTIPMTATFSESVTGFSDSQLTLVNGTTANLAGSGRTYTFDLNPGVEGAVTVALPAAQATDAAGNTNTASAVFTKAYDLTAPTVTVTGTGPAVTNTTIPIRIVFNEAVSGFTVGDLTVVGGTAGSFAGSGATYTAVITATTDGTVTVDIAAAVCTDIAGNSSAAGTAQYSAVFDHTLPTATIASTATSPTSAAFPVTIVFSEPVTAFVLANVTVTNGAISGFSGSGANYAFTVTPPAQGTVVVALTAGKVKDLAGNFNLAAGSLTMAFDSVRPTVVLSSTLTAASTNLSTIPVTATFSEAVTGVDFSTLTLVNGVVANFAGSGRTYTFDLNPTAEGTVSVTVPVNNATDGAGNGNTASTTFTRAYDLTGPTPTITSSAANLVSTTIPVVVTWNEAVTGFTLADVTVGNGTAGSFAGSGASYSFVITATADGTVTVDIAGSTCTDIATNANNAATQFGRVVFDHTAPTAVITTTASSPTNAAIPVTITFSEPVTAFVVANVTVTNGAISGFAGSGATYSFTITPPAQGTATIALAASKVKDIAGNFNLAATSLPVVFDTVRPTVALTAALASSSFNTGSFHVTATFSEAVTGFDDTDVTVVNGAVANLTGSGASYSFDVTTAVTGAVAVSIAANVCTDLATNNNQASTTLTKVYDLNGPGMIITSTAPTITNAAIPVTITFDQPVTGFAVGDLTVGNGTAGSFTGSGATYSAVLTASGDGTVTLDIAAGVCQDLAANDNTTGIQFVRTFDHTAPTAAFATTAANPGNVAIPVTVTFSETVTGFAASALTLTNGTASAVSGSGATYSFTVTATTQGTVTVAFAAGKFHDVPGNLNTATTTLSVVFDTVRPSVSLTSSVASATFNTGSFPVVVTFSEAVTGFDASSLTIGNGAAANFAGSGASYSFDVTTATPGAVTVAIAASVCTDVATNANLASAVLTKTYDTTGQTPVIASTAPALTNAAIPITVTFGQAVTGFTSGDLTIGNGTVTAFTGSGATYAATITATTDGTVTVDIAAGVAQDLAGNDTSTGAQFSRSFDHTLPTAAIAFGGANPTNVAIPVTVTFSEPVSGFLATALTLTNGSVSAFAGSGATYTFTMTATTQGTVTVAFAAAKYRDLANNLNTATTTQSAVFDTVRPTVVLSTSLASGSFNSGTFHVIATFSEVVTGFDVSDITVTNGAAAGFTGTGASYAFDVTTATLGAVSVSIAANVCTDLAINNNVASSALVKTYDTNGPGVLVTSNAPVLTNSTIPITVTFDQAVTGFIAGDLTVGNGTVTAFSGSGATYAVTITATTDGTVTVDIAGGVAQDLAGNDNTTGAQFSRTFDHTLPTAAIAFGGANPTNVAFPVTVTFSEPVSGFLATALTLTNGTVSGFAGSGATYTFTMTPIAQGTATVAFAAGKYRDLAGNFNTATTTQSVVFDTVRPTVALTTSLASGSFNSGTFHVIATFSEAVTGFDVSDVTVTNGAAAGFTGTGASYAFDVTTATLGAVSVSIAANVCTDLAINNNVASSALVKTYDTNGPGVVVTSNAPALTNTTIPITVTFDQAVTGFIAGDLTVGNGAVSAFSGSGATYAVTITATTDGTVTVDIAGGVAQDLAGNNNTTGAQFSRTFDHTLPTAAIAFTGSNPSNVALPVTVTFSEPVSGFLVSALTLTNGTASAATGSGATYSFTVTATTQGTVTVAFAATKYRDLAGNFNTATTTQSAVFDTVRPTVALSTSLASGSFNSGTFHVIATFSEAVTGFDVSDVTVTNGAAAGFTGTGASYAFDVTTATVGAVSVSIAANVCTDLASNNNVAASALVKTYDTSAPGLLITSAAPASTNSTIPLTVTFDQAVTGFVSGDLTVGNGTVTAFSGAGATYAVTITATTDGTVTVDVAGGVAQDLAGNDNTTGAQFSRTFDHTAPTAAIALGGANPTNTTIPVTVTFSEPVSGFLVSALTLTNGTASAATGSGATYSFTVTATTQGTVTVAFAANKYRDLAGNFNAATTTQSAVFDTVRPTVALTSTTTSPLFNTGTFHVIATFSEAVTGFDVSDVTVTNGAAAGFTGTGASYAFDVTTATIGQVSVSIAASVCTDLAINNNLAATALVKTYDTNGPGVTITSTAPAITNAAIPVTITFDQQVTGFGPTALTIGNGTVSAFSGSGATYAVTISATTDGTVTIDIAAGVCQDLAGNNNTTGAQFSRTFDHIAPTAAIALGGANPTNTTIPVTVTFSETVSGFAASALTITNGTASAVSGSGATYTFTVTATTQGTVTVAFAASKYRDLAGNFNTATTTQSALFDSVRPTVVLSTSLASGSFNTGTFHVIATFSEAVTGFDVSDVTVTNGAAAGFTGSGASYAFDVTTATPGVVTASIATTTCTDAAINANTASNTLTKVYNTTGPVPAIASSAPGLTNTTIPITVTFTAPVTGFAQGDLTIGNGTVSAFSGSGATYAATITATTDGTVTIDIAAGVAQDLAGNDNSTGVQLARTFDHTLPTAAIALGGANPTNTTIPVTITFSEAVSGFAASALTITNGTASAASGSGATYSLTVTATTQGTVTVAFAANKYRDFANNFNTATTTQSAVFDTVRPTVALSTSLVSGSFNTGTFHVIATFSEAVTGFDVSDVTVTNGAAAGFTGTGASYAFDVTTAVQGAVGVSIAASVCTDTANNNNVASNALSKTYDTTGPVPTIASTAPAITNATIPITVTFDQPVTGFVQGDLTIGNGTVSAFSGSGATYAATITATSDGTVTVDIAGGVAQDLAGNNNTTGVQLARTFDHTAPTAAIAFTGSNPTNLAIPVTVTFSEPVSGFLATALTVSNGAVSGLTGSGATYAFTVTPSAQGTVTVAFAAGKYRDLATNLNTATTTLSTIFDTVRPTVVLSTSLASSTFNTGSFHVIATFSEAVTSFDVSDVTVTGGAASAFTGTGASYAFDVTTATPGAVGVAIATSVCTDIATNSNIASSTLTRTFDTSGPGLVITSIAAAATNAPIPITVTFDQAVTGFVQGDLTVGNGTVTAFSGSGATYAVTITATTDGTVTVDIAAGVAQDLAGNDNTTGAQFSRTFDHTIPTAAIALGGPNPTNSAIPVTVTFSEPVSGFTAGALTISNGVVSAFTGSGATYTFTVTPPAQGTVTLAFAAGKYRDIAGNFNTATTTQSAVFDTVRPTVALTTSQASATFNTGTFHVIATFSEAVTGFDVSDVTVTNGAATAFTGTGASYAFDVTTAVQGTVGVAIATSVCTDLASNNNVAGTTLSRIYDTTGPTVTIASSAPALTNSTIPITLTFSEVVTGFTSGDLTVGNGTVTAFSGSGATYAATITATTDGSVTVDIAGGVCTDLAGNGSTTGTQFSRTFDHTLPTAAIAFAGASPTNAPLAVTVTFSEPVTGFLATALTVSNGAVSGFTGSGATYTFTVTPAAQGSVSVALAAAKYHDLANNNNTATTTQSAVFDTVRPTVALSTGLTSATFNTGTFHVIATFSEAVTGFDVSDVTVTNGAASAFTGTGASYAFDVTTATEGAVGVAIAATVCTDIATNNNVASSTLTKTYDVSGPAVVITSAAAALVNAPFTITVTFDQAVTGFALGDLTVGNGTASALTGSGATYALSISPTADGTVTVDIAAGVAQDLAGNDNTTGVQFSRTFDHTLPTAAIAISGANPTNVPIPVTVTFSEPVSGFLATALTVTNGSVSALTGSGATYTFTVTATAQGTVTVAFAANKYRDLAGNFNTATTTLSTLFDSVGPTVTLTSTSTSRTRLQPIPVTATFSESVTGFVVGDLTVTNGTAGNFTGTGRTYTFDITPTAAGVLTVSIASGVATDTAGNGNTTSNTLSRTFDDTGPRPVITSAAPSLEKTPTISVTVTFPESVSGFTIADLIIGNGFATAFAGSGATYTFTLNQGQGTVTVDIDDNVCVDLAGNGNLSAVQFSRIYDSIPPTAVVTTSAGVATASASIAYTITFSEDVTGFALNKLTVINGTASSLAGTGPTYTFNVTATASGQVVVGIADNAINDVAGNANRASNYAVVTYLASGPTVTISTAISEWSAATAIPIQVTVVFSASVTGFTVGDLTVGNGSAGNFAGSGRVYTFDLTPTSTGAPVTVDVSAGVATDAATNGNLVAPQLNLVYMPNGNG